MPTDSRSYWQSTAPALSLSTKLPRMIDVAIIGGGLLGAAACYWLARQGIAVALLERSVLASGATGRNGGFVVAGPTESYPKASAHLGHEAAHATMEITYESQALLRQVLQEEDIACDYREPGTIRLALTEEQAQRLTEEVAMRQADGFPAQFLEREQLQMFIKTPLSSEILGGRFLPEQGLLHSARLVHGLAQAALRRGGQAYQAEVYGLVADGGGVRIKTSRGTLLAQTAIIAVNAWTGRLLPALADLIVPVREQMLAYAPVKPLFTTGLSATVTTDEYWQQTPDGVILIGGCGSVAPNDDIGVWESVPTAIVQEAIERVLPRLFPSFTPSQVIRRWAGLLDYTTDSHPIVDHAPDLDHVFFVAGFSGHGMPYGMRFGQLLASAVQRGELPSALRPFRLDRPTLSEWNVLQADFQE